MLSYSWPLCLRVSCLCLTFSCTALLIYLALLCSTVDFVSYLRVILSCMGLLGQVIVFPRFPRIVPLFYVLVALLGLFSLSYTTLLLSSRRPFSCIIIVR